MEKKTIELYRKNLMIFDMNQMVSSIGMQEN